MPLFLVENLSTGASIRYISTSYYSVSLYINLAGQLPVVGKQIMKKSIVHFFNI